MEIPVTTDFAIDTTMPREFSFDEFFKCSSGTFSPMAELQKSDLSVREWTDHADFIKLKNSASVSKESFRRWQGHLGKRSHSDSLYESTDCADADLTSSGNPIKLTLVRLLMKTLVHEQIDIHDIEAFDSRDLDILRSIVKRKYRFDIGSEGFDDKKKLLAELNSLDIEKRTEKRSEENNKLMFKRAIKYLIIWYKKNRWQDMKELRKKQYETMICKEFFSDVPLPECCKPKSLGEDTKDNAKRTSSRKKESAKAPSQAEQATAKADELLRKFVINPNTINAKYIKYVFQSDSFKDFFDDFVANHFIADYKKHRGSKIVKIIDTVYSSLTSTSNQNDTNSVKEYIEKNPKFKLPWTDNELELCTESTRQFILRVFRSRAAKPFSDRKTFS